MSGDWQCFDFYLLDDMPRAQVIAELRRRIVLAASDGGEFVGRFHILGSETRSDGWRRWTAAYLAGPPRITRINDEMKVNSS